MKNLKVVLGIGVLAVASFFVIAADHIDAPAVKGGTSDITDFYAFQGQNTSNLVFVANIQGLLSPTATASAMFEEDVLIEFNIDTTGDNVEDLVIQAIPRNGKMYFFGPMKPAQTGLSSTILKTATNGGVVDITTYGSNAKTSSNGGMTFFAGPRDDPFFFDFAQYSKIIGGTASGFLPKGTGTGKASDTFAGSNVLSIVVEVPKSMIGGTGAIKTWVESKRK